MPYIGSAVNASSSSSRRFVGHKLGTSRRAADEKNVAGCFEDMYGEGAWDGHDGRGDVSEYLSDGARTPLSPAGLDTSHSNAGNLAFAGSSCSENTFSSRASSAPSSLACHRLRNALSQRQYRSASQPLSPFLFPTSPACLPLQADAPGRVVDEIMT
eukprot:TRINITY_DN32332_c0_g1_i1.p2 TRINITY_DN32332_c0_g1~~TRINITY_DN32332_c0_g1_i1.p2  ORF type:complete len:157 (+),score=26.56 TRINITY_DN32332_c0_g1_i1:78-548(+)